LPPATEPRRGLPTWLMAVLFAVGFVGVVFGIYSLVSSKSHSSPPAPAAAVESPAAKPGAKPNPLQKYIEVSGVRFAEEKAKPVVKFVITNHSGADITGLAGNVTIWGRTQKSEEDAQGTFTFSGANIGPYESKDLSAPLNTKLKIYELPDWQNVTTDIQVTAPVENVDSGG